ncbi:MAG: ATPase, T2SS/T4P/T4SS family [Thermoproteota archaeon]
MIIKKVKRFGNSLLITVNSNFDEGLVDGILSYVIFYMRFFKNISSVYVEFKDYKETIVDKAILSKCLNRAYQISKLVKAIALKYKSKLEGLNLSYLSVYPTFGELYNLNKNIRQEDLLADSKYSANSNSAVVEIPDSLSHLSIVFKRDMYYIKYKGAFIKRILLDAAYFLRWIVNEQLLEPNRFDDFVKYRYKFAIRYLNKISKNLSSQLISSLAIHSVFVSMGLASISPLFFDKNINEIYLDDVDKAVYVELSGNGRLSTNIKPRDKEVKALLSALRRNSGQELSLSSPSIKGDLSFHNCILRVSFDSFPLVNYLSFDIRKLSKESKSLSNLIQNGTIDKATASFLISLLRIRANMSIVGEPGSGKTTLLASVLNSVPKNWRVIILEDVPEISYSFYGSNFCLKLFTNPFESKVKVRKKSEEIIKLLHRNPTYVVLGELQYEDHFKSLFYALSSGLRVAHTSHAPSVSGFIDRVVNVYKVSSFLIPYLDVVLEMRKIEKDGKIIRRLSSIGLINVSSAYPYELKIINLGDNNLDDVEEVYQKWIKIILAKRNEISYTSNFCFLQSDGTS